MARRFKMIVDYDKVLDQAITIRDVLPPELLARFIVEMVSWVDLTAIYAQYAPLGGEAYAPEILLALPSSAATSSMARRVSTDKAISFEITENNKREGFASGDRPAVTYWNLSKAKASGQKVMVTADAVPPIRAPLLIEKCGYEIGWPFHDRSRPRWDLGLRYGIAPRSSRTIPAGRCVTFW